MERMQQPIQQQMMSSQVQLWAASGPDCDPQAMMSQPYYGHQRRPRSIKKMEPSENVIRWLEDVNYQLDTDLCTDDREKTMEFKLALTGSLREAAQLLQVENPNIMWRDLIVELKKSHLPSSARFAARQMIQFSKFNYEERFDKWLQRWEDAFFLIYGLVRDDLKAIILFGALPLTDQLAISRGRHDSSYAEILNYMSTNDTMKRMQKKTEARPLATQQRSQQQNRIQGNPPPRYLQSQHHNRPNYHGTSSGSYGYSRNANDGRQPNRNGCYNCGNTGHISANCPQAKVRTIDEKEKEEPPPQRGRRRSPKRRRRRSPLPTLDVLQGDDSTPEGAEEQIRMVENEEEDTYQLPPSPPETNKCFELPIEVRLPDEEIMSHHLAVIDTGADISLIHCHVVTEIPVTLYPVDSKVSGVNAGSIELLGFCYLLLKPKGSKTVKLMKFYVIKELSSSFLLGANFLRTFSVNLDADDGKMITTVGKGEDRLENPLLMLKAIPLEELNNWIRKQEKATGAKHPPPVALFPGNHGPPKVLRGERVLAIDMQTEAFENWDQSDQLRQIIHPGLTDQQKEESFDLLWEFRDVFSQGDHDLGLVPYERTNIEIELDGNVPFQGSYNVSPEKKIKFEETVKPLMEAGILEESTDAGGVPALLVDKPNGSYRLVVDYRKLNAKCRKIEYPMPNIDTCLEALKGSKYYFSGDLAQGYHQLELAPKERRKTVFVTPDRKLRYTRLPMGYVNAPYHFQKFINEVLEDMQYKNFVGYFDDITSFGRTWEEFLLNTRKLFQRIRANGIKFKTQKCNFGVPEIKFLGHYVNEIGIRPNPAKVEALKSLKYPETKKALRSMLGMFTFFSRYIKNFSIIAQPLFELTSQTAVYRLLKEHEEAIDKLKEALVTDCLLNHFKADLPTKLSCDASDKAIGGILMQQETIIDETSGKEEKVWRPVSYYSQILLSHQRNYTVSEKETLGILIGITKFRHYLEGKEFMVETDHHALCQLPTLKFKNGRINRWSLLLQAFRYTVVYHTGEGHLSDCLSRDCAWDHRKPITEESEMEDRVLAVDLLEENTGIDSSVIEEIKLIKLGEGIVAEFNSHQCEDLYNEMEILLAEESHFQHDLQSYQHEDKFYSSIIQDLRSNDPEKQNSKEVLRNYSLRKGLLYRNPEGKYGKRLVLTRKMFQELFRYEHDLPEGGHFGTGKTFERLKRHYLMPKLFEEISKACEQCNLCAMYKATSRVFSEAQLKGIDPSPFGTLELDVQGPFKRSKNGNKVVIVLTDSLTRYAFAKAARNQETPQILEFLTEIFNVFGYPRIIRTDQGTNFMSDQFAEFLTERDIKHYISNAYHPQGQGQVERMNRTLGERIKIFADENHRKWDEKLPSILFGINSAVHSTTGYPPNYLLFGFTPRKLSDLRFDVKLSFGNIQLARARAYDKLVEQQRRIRERLMSSSTPSNYQPGDLVVIKRKAPDLVRGKKLTKPYYGPVLVIEHKRGHVNTISLMEESFGHKNSYNVDMTKPFHGSLTLNQKKKLREFCSTERIASSMCDESEDDERSGSMSNYLNDAPPKEKKIVENSSSDGIESLPTEKTAAEGRKDEDMVKGQAASRQPESERDENISTDSSVNAQQKKNGDGSKLNSAVKERAERENVGSDPNIDLSVITGSIMRYQQKQAGQTSRSHKYNLRSNPKVRLIDSSRLDFDFPMLMKLIRDDDELFKLSLKSSNCNTTNKQHEMIHFRQSRMIHICID